VAEDVLDPAERRVRDGADPEQIRKFSVEVLDPGGEQGDVGEGGARTGRA